ncbi:MAG: hypothetical protein M3112_03815 [Actinomycetia bacterium]|nr:hypothetical protein [Actinomycetes bacterium]
MGPIRPTDELDVRVLLGQGVYDIAEFLCCHNEQCPVIDYLPHLPTGSAATVQVLVEPVSVISGGLQLQAEQVQAALDRYATAGLELPPVDVYLHVSSLGCGGNSGLFTPGSEIDRIDLCVDTPFIILHEFGHAWENRFGTDDAREQLLDGLGLEFWTGADVKYRRRGVEAAANLIAWGLSSPSVAERGQSPNTDRLDLFASFTGSVPLRSEG